MKVPQSPSPLVIPKTEPVDANADCSWEFQEFKIDHCPFSPSPEYALLSQKSLKLAMDCVRNTRVNSYVDTRGLIIFDNSEVYIRQGVLRYINKIKKELLATKRYVTVYEFNIYPMSYFARAIITALKNNIANRLSKVGPFRFHNQQVLDGLRYFCQRCSHTKYTALPTM